MKSRNQILIVTLIVPSLLIIFSGVRWTQKFTSDAHPPASSRSPTHGGITISLRGATMLGSNNAPVVMAEFTDYECYFCGTYARDVYPHIVRDFVDTGKVKYAFRHLPSRSHPNAFRAAIAFECASSQGHGAEMHTQLFASPGALTEESISGYAKHLTLDEEGFRRCVDESDGRATSRVIADMRDASRLQIKATPSFLIGELQSEQMTIIRGIRGLKPYSEFKDALEDAWKRVSER